jgi:hypothetical protein
MAVICVKETALVNLMFEQCKWILKCYWTMENVTEVHRRWRNEFGTPPPPPLSPPQPPLPSPTLLTVTVIRGKLEVYGIVQNVNKGQTGRPRSSTHYESVATVLQAKTQSPKKSVRQ